MSWAWLYGTAQRRLCADCGLPINPLDEVQNPDDCRTCWEDEEHRAQAIAWRQSAVAQGYLTESEAAS